MYRTSNAKAVYRWWSVICCQLAPWDLPSLPLVLDPLLITLSPSPPAQVNTEIVAIQRVKTTAGAAHLRKLIETHVEKTGSAKGKAILSNWDAMLPKFWQLVPPAEKNTPEVNPDVPQQVPAGKVAVSA